MTRRSTSGAVIMAEGMRLHAHSRGQASVALSSCEAEVMAASEGIKEALLLQEVLMFVGLGHYEIEIKVDSSAAHAKRCSEQDKELMATRRYKPVPVENLKVYSHVRGGVSNSIVYSSHARHVSIWCDCFCVVR